MPSEVNVDEKPPTPHHGAGEYSRLRALLVITVGFVTITTLVGVAASLPHLGSNPDATYWISSLAMSAALVFAAALFRWHHRDRWKGVIEHEYTPKRLYQPSRAPSNLELAMVSPAFKVNPWAIVVWVFINLIVAFMAVTA